MEYSAKPYRNGLRPSWGYYVCPTDHKVQIPDPKKLDALHYAFRMKARYNTPLRECTRWLHASTGQLMSAAGFLGSYKRWIRNLRKERGKEIIKATRKKQADRKKFIEDNFKHFGITINDPDDISAVASLKERETREKKESAAGQAS